MQATRNAGVCPSAAKVDQGKDSAPPLGDSDEQGSHTGDKELPVADTEGSSSQMGPSGPGKAGTRQSRARLCGCRTP